MAERSGDVPSGIENEVSLVMPRTPELANPAPLGLFSFALTTALLQAATTKMADHDGAVGLTACVGLFYGGLVQLLVGQWEIKRNNIFGLTAFSSYGAFWMGLGLYDLLVLAGVIDKDVGALRMLLVLYAIITMALFLQTFKMNIALGVLFFSLATLFILLAAAQTRETFTQVSGVWGLWTAAVAFYCGVAELTNEVYHRRVLPLGVLSGEPHWGNACPGLGVPLTKAYRASDLHGPGCDEPSAHVFLHPRPSRRHRMPKGEEQTPV